MNGIMQDVGRGTDKLVAARMTFRRLFLVGLTALLADVVGFARDNDTEDVKFLLIAGSAGIEAVTNIVVKSAWREMLFLVYGAVAILCLITFRTWRAVVAALLPLMLTSLLAEALMVILLAFMFLWNMLGALVLLPALAHFLLKPANRSDSTQAGSRPVLHL
jgi:predicted RND superfamily exporter protein